MTSQNDQAVEQLYDYVATGLNDGKSVNTLTAELVQHGVPNETASTIVSQVSEARIEALRRRGIKTVAIGVGFFVLGIIITGVTYATAAPGQTFVVTTGLFLIGVFNMARGLFRVITAK